MTQVVGWSFIHFCALAATPLLIGPMNRSTFSVSMSRLASLWNTSTLAWSSARMSFTGRPAICPPSCCSSQSSVSAMRLPFTPNGPVYSPMTPILMGLPEAAAAALTPGLADTPAEDAAAGEAGAAVEVAGEEAGAAAPPQAASSNPRTGANLVSTFIRTDLLLASSGRPALYQPLVSVLWATIGHPILEVHPWQTLPPISMLRRRSSPLA